MKCFQSQCFFRGSQTEDSLIGAKYPHILKQGAVLAIDQNSMLIYCETGFLTVSQPKIPCKEEKEECINTVNLKNQGENKENCFFLEVLSFKLHFIL